MNNVRNTVSALLAEFDKVVVGYDDAKRKIVMALLSDQHVLLESVPGLAKTLLIETLQQCISGATSSRIQFTPDLKPQDIIGFRVFNQETRTFDDEVGPIYNHLVLGDELNRAPGKTQSALLSPMQERKFFIGKRLYTLPELFLVLATINPIEQEGTFPLPEAQQDRFAMKIRLDYVSREDERRMLRNQALEGRNAHALAQPVLSVDEVVALRKEIRDTVYVSDALLDYVIALVRATRPSCDEFKDVTKKIAKVGNLIKVGASPRAEQTLIKLGRVNAASQGRDFVLPEDVRKVAFEVLRHRIILSDDAIFDSVSPDEPIAEIMKAVPIVDDVEKYKRR